MSTPVVQGPRAEAIADRIVENVSSVLHGKNEVVRLALTAIVARGHLLLEDRPGVGKTTLASALAASIGGEFRRIQFTSDLLPSDILGVNAWDATRSCFEFHPGPIFCQVLLADEINRTSPKTQSALLEAMSEGQVTLDEQRRDLPSPFLVIATQNPTEHSGTHPLPDSQLDRFMLRTRMGYPERDDEVALLLGAERGRVKELKPVSSPDELLELSAAAERVQLHEDLAAHAVEIVRATRNSEHFAVGASPRAGLDLAHAARASALLAGRDHVVPDDLRRLTVPVLAHRLAPRDGRVSDPRVEAQLRSLLETLPAPD